MLWYFSNAGLLAETLGHVDEAIGLHRRAVEQDPLSAPTYANLGNMLHDADRLAEAGGRRGQSHERIRA
jgi:tetratricopeptide (TPR) repeat protein